MYQLLGPLSTSKENVLTSRCHVSQLFSQWAISTGEKSPKNYWGTFFQFHLKFWKVLIKPQLSFKEFLQNQSVKKKKFSSSLKVTQLQVSDVRKTANQTQHICYISSEYYCQLPVCVTETFYAKPSLLFGNHLTKGDGNQINMTVINDITVVK